MSYESKQLAWDFSAKYRRNTPTQLSLRLNVALYRNIPTKTLKSAGYEGRLFSI